MPFTAFDIARLSKVLVTWREEVPQHVRHQLQRGFRIGSSDVVIFERRPHFQRVEEWREHDVAKFRFVAAANEWRLFCKFRDGRWRAYAPLASAASFEELFAEVRRDPTHIFWG